MVAHEEAFSVFCQRVNKPCSCSRYRTGTRTGTPEIRIWPARGKQFRKHRVLATPCFVVFFFFPVAPICMRQECGKNNCTGTLLILPHMANPVFKLLGLPREPERYSYASHPQNINAHHATLFHFISIFLDKLPTDEIQSSV